MKEGDMSCFLHRMRVKEERKKALARKNKEASLVNNPNEEAGGVYQCSNCGNALFEADKKFESGTGFPSFWMYIGENVKENFLTTYGRERTQLLCNQCGLHLGHLFPHKRTPTRIRYCINESSISLDTGLETES